MLKTPTAASWRSHGQVVVRVGLSAAVSLGFVLPLLAARSLDRGQAMFVGVTLAVLLPTLLRPAVGLSVLLLLLPFSTVLEQQMGGHLLAGDVVDALVLAFACGATLSVLAQRHERASRLGAICALFAVVVLTSTISELRLLQAVTPRVSVWPRVWQQITQDYWTETREWLVLRHTFRWLAWLVVAVAVERLVSARAQTARMLLRMWFIAGVAGTLLVLARMAEVVVGHVEPVGVALGSVLLHTRLSVLQPDVNAAGSYLLLFLIPALIIGVRRRSVWLLAVCVPLLLASFGMARSRAAIGAGVLVLCAAGVSRLWLGPGGDREDGHRRRALLAAGVIAVGGLMLVGTLYATSRSNAAVDDALGIRMDLMRVGVEAAKRAPVFGVGLGDYIRSTRRFMTPEMTLLRTMAPQGENAHNNFLQIAVELGIPACLLFLWLVGRGVAAALPVRRVRLTAEAEGLALGVVAYLLSAILGHPLLVPLTGTVFFVALGMTAGWAAGARLPAPRTAAAWQILAGFYLGSLVWRW